MMNANNFQTLLADVLFNGDTAIAGMVMFAAVMGIVFALTKSDFRVGILVMIPVALIFSSLGILTSELTILLIVIAVVALVAATKRMMD